MNTLYFGDNLEILQKYIEPNSVDLVYLDPPFNSNRAYNVFFHDKTGKSSAAQIQAFEDTWTWTSETQDAFDQIIKGSYPLELKDMMKSFREFMGPINLMAYLTMMAIRLMELHRTLKDTGSLYLHCDPTASHYLKILLDQVFGVKHFRNEVIWKRTDAKGNVQKKYGWIHDRLLFYTKSNKWVWNQQHVPYNQDYMDEFYAKKDAKGRMYQADNLTAPMSRASKGQIYSWKGYTPPSTRCFVYNKEKMEQLDREGKIEYTGKGCPRLIRYLDEMPGNKCPDIWTDIRFAQKSERLGYPTQKPIALLERIIRSSSNEGDRILDPFCGCGTAIAAAEKLGRSWIGIDITYQAIDLIKKRIHAHFPDAKFAVVGEPKSVEDAERLFHQSPFQFERWAVSLVGGESYKGMGGGDSGIDGIIIFKDAEDKYQRIIIEVKGGAYHPKDIRALARVLQREEAPMGILLALQQPTKGMLSEAAGLGKWSMPRANIAYPMLQVFTIKNYFSGKRPNLPISNVTFEKAKRAVREKEERPPRLI